MNDRQFDDPLKELSESLHVAPSTGFAAKVRARTHGVRERNDAMMWLGIAAAAVLLVGGMSILLPRRPPAATAVTVATADAPSSVVAPPAPRESSPQPLKQVARTSHARAVTTPAAPATPGPREPEVLVSSDQLLGIAQMRARLSEGTLTGDLIPESYFDRAVNAEVTAPVPMGSEPGPNDDGRIPPLRYGVRYSD